jgi:hypothetical protein
MDNPLKPERTHLQPIPPEDHSEIFHLVGLIGRITHNSIEIVYKPPQFAYYIKY